MAEALLRRRESHHLLRRRLPRDVGHVGADGDDEIRVAEGELRPCDAVRSAIGLDDRAVCLEVHAEMRLHGEAGEPRVEEGGEASALMLVEEDAIAGDT